MFSCCVLCLIAQSCPTLCNPMNCSLPGSSVPGNFPGKNTRLGCHALLQGIFQNHESNPGLLHSRRILYHLSYQGCPGILSRVALSLFQGIFLTQELIELSIYKNFMHIYRKVKEKAIH